jgi:hypothetical protein
MNSKTNTLLITSILAFALLANVNVGAPVFATGGLDDEEEEEAIEELQNAVQEIKGTLGTIELNLTEGSNDIQANCPSTEEIVQEVVENITSNNNNETQEQPQCPLVPEEQPVQNQTIIPPVEAVEEPEQNETQQGCNPVPEEPAVEENKTSDLLPIICPINGELLGYTNTTSGEQLPISAGNETIQVEEFLPPIEIPTEPEQNQTTVVPQEPQQCNVTAPQEPAEEQPTTIVPEQNITTNNNPVEFDVNCGCYAVDKSTQEVQ